MFLIGNIPYYFFRSGGIFEPERFFPAQAHKAHGIKNIDYGIYYPMYSPQCLGLVYYKSQTGINEAVPREIKHQPRYYPKPVIMSNVGFSIVE